MSNLPISNHLTERHRFIQCKKKKRNDIIAYNDHRNVRNYSVFIFKQILHAKSGIKETVMLIFLLQYPHILGVFWPQLHTFHDSSNLVCGNLLYIITFMI